MRNDIAAAWVSGLLVAVMIIPALVAQSGAADAAAPLFRVPAAATPSTTPPAWLPVPLGMGEASVSAVAVSPQFQTDSTIFIAAHTSFASHGVLKSTNGGQTWTAMNAGLPSATISALAISPSYGEDRTIFAATQAGLFRSTNGGSLWARLQNGLPEPSIGAIALSPAFNDDRTLFVATGSGIFKSQDGGNTWVLASNGIADRDGRSLPTTCLDISPEFARDHTLFAGTPQWEVGGGLFRTTNGGKSWQEVNTGIPQYFGGITTLRVSPSYAQDRTVFAGVWANRIYRSTDGGTTWQPTNSGLPAQAQPWIIVTVFAASPRYDGDHTLFAGTLEGGVFRSTNGGNSWTALSSGLDSPNVLSLAFTPISPYWLLAGTDTGLWRHVFTTTAPTHTATPTRTPTITPTPTATPTLIPTPDGGWPVNLLLPIVVKP